MKRAEEILIKNDIAATPVRVLVMQCLLKAESPLSLSSIETLLETVDKSTISRSLAIFREHHLLHSFDDGSGSTKYEFCRSQDTIHHDDNHVHFRCEECGETKCLTSVKIPEIALPEGYELHETNYIITGICAKCSQQSKD